MNQTELLKSMMDAAEWIKRQRSRGEPAEQLIHPAVRRGIMALTARNIAGVILQYQNKIREMDEEAGEVVTALYAPVLQYIEEIIKGAWSDE